MEPEGEQAPKPDRVRLTGQVTAEEKAAVTALARSRKCDNGDILREMTLTQAVKEYHEMRALFSAP